MNIKGIIAGAFLSALSIFGAANADAQVRVRVDTRTHHHYYHHRRPVVVRERVVVHRRPMVRERVVVRHRRPVVRERVVVTNRRWHRRY